MRRPDLGAVADLGVVADPRPVADLHSGVDDHMAADQDAVADLHALAEQQPGGEVGGLQCRPAHRAGSPRVFERLKMAAC